MAKNTDLCARCGVAPRNSSLKSYCVDCKRAFGREADARRKERGRNPLPCSRCGGENTGRHPSYCAECWRQRAEEGLQRPCIRCGSIREPNDRSSKSYCKPCFRDLYLQREFGISLAEYNAIFDRQRRRCAVCKAKEHGAFNWHVDHDHVTGQVRGILCRGCNTGIGQLGDDPDRMRAALRYVETHRQMHLF